LNKRLRWQLIILVCMYLGYMSLMVCRNTAIVASPAMIADVELGMDKASYGRMMSYHSAGGVLGKAVTGVAVDRFGGRAIFLLMIALTSLTTAGFGLASRFGVLAGLNMAGQAAKSGGWPAMAALIRSWYPPDQHGRVWGVISTSSRVGVMTATLFLGYLLSRGLPWRQLFMVSAGVGVAMMIVGFFLLKSSPESVGLTPPVADGQIADEKPSHPLDGLTFKQGLGVFIRSRRVWLISITMWFTTILMDFLNYIPLFLAESLGLEPGQAGMAGTVFPAGCFVAVLAAGVLYDKLSHKRRVWVIGGLLFSGALSLSGLWVLSGASVSPNTAYYLSLALIFYFGLAIAPAYYLPMSVFSISYGGPFCGFLICLFDIFGYAGAFGFNFFAGSYIQSHGWNPFLGFLIGVTVIATILLMKFLHLDYQAELKGEV
jgi:OPA family sugar phosphate sensor protein UhpC-like MFS transporter